MSKFIASTVSPTEKIIKYYRRVTLSSQTLWNGMVPGAVVTNLNCLRQVRLGKVVLFLNKRSGKVTEPKWSKAASLGEA